MKEILGDEDDPKVSQVRKRNARKKGCMDTILDGSFMGLVLVGFKWGSIPSHANNHSFFH